MSTTTTSTTGETAPEAGPDEAHHPSDWLYVQVAIILGVITAAEVSTYLLDFGPFQLPALVVMMAVKFALVVMFFMHLRFDNKLFSWVFVSGLVLAVLVYGIALSTFRYWQSL
jgi:cytochrome c oxidase subunit IV